MRLKRRSGVLLHPTSLPGRGGIGTLGAEAFAFADFLKSAGQTLWQVLPLGPVAYGNSPYSCYSAFAGNPLLIDLQALVEEGDLVDGDVIEVGNEELVRFDDVVSVKIPVLRQAAARFFSKSGGDRVREYEQFCSQSEWLHDFALYMSLKEHFEGKSWNQWPGEIVSRKPGMLTEFAAKLAGTLREHKYMQWQFFRQWARLKQYANNRGIQIIGDIPIFVAYDSADVWSSPGLFQLDASGAPSVVAGVPPDYFSATGQLWGNPLYNWDAAAADGYSWWVARVRASLLLYDWVRIDHFRGFAAYWEVPATETTAINGKWVDGPGEKLFLALEQALGKPLPIIAEDLGLITPDVEELRDAFRFPGMKVLQFAFGSGPDNYYLPHNYSRCCVAYTGTHDNNTTRGWFAEVGQREREHAMQYLRCSEQEVVWQMIRAAYASVAAFAVIPVQDLFGFDADARINTPGVASGNWEWRLRPGLLDSRLAQSLREMSFFFNRLCDEEAAH